MKHHFFPLLLSIPFVMASCSSNPSDAASKAHKETETPIVATLAVSKIDVVEAPSGPAANAATILARKQVPVLCYHHIHDFTGREKPVTKDYIVPPANFREQIKSLADSGYHTILPEQYNNYLLYGTPLPSKPV